MSWRVPRSVLGPPQRISHLWGMYRRHRGCYDQRTEWLLQVGVSGSTSVNSVLRHRCFQRDLGKPLGAENVGELLTLAKPATDGYLLRYCNLIAEGGGADQLFECVGVNRLRALAGCCPAVAALLAERHCELSADELALARLHSKQVLWRQQFAGQVRRANGSLCVVGNSDNLCNLGRGAEIDSHSIIVRFNNFSARRLCAEDVGSRLGVWVRAPGYRQRLEGDGPVPSWILLSGPDVRFQLRDWSAIAPWLKAGAKVLTVPLEPWRRLVRQLQAPPSAGLLVIEWLLQLQGRQRHLRVLGFESGRARGARRRSRHNWEGERRILQDHRRAGVC